MEEITIGIFNLNNLFSRYNFKGAIEEMQPEKSGLTVEYRFTDPESYRIRTYKGKLVKEKPQKDTDKIAQRIKERAIDILAVQEAEDIDTLRFFNKEYLDGKFNYQVLLEGNDPRLIDVGLLSTYPIGGITSWQRAIHPADPNEPVFGRDLLEVEILTKDRTATLFTIFNNHLKSNYIPYNEDKEEGEAKIKQRRQRQAETIARIVKAKMPEGRNFIILGDMNDSHDSALLEPFVKGLSLTNALANAQETSPPKKDDPMPTSPMWTHRFKPSGEPAKYELYDQIWLSPALKDTLKEAWIGRRKNLTGDGSDHDPAWVTLHISG